MEKRIVKKLIRSLKQKKQSVNKQTADMMRGGQSSSTCTRYRSCCHGNILSKNIQHDVYACYHEKNDAEVLNILDDLRRQKLDVYNPYRDGMPNETRFKAWLERGILNSKLSLIFLTKSFVKSYICKYQSDQAAMHNVKTKGRHRVVLIMLQSCRIPKNLKQFNCVFAWKYREDPFNQIQKIMKAISAPQSRFRRGSVIWTAGRSMIGKQKLLELPNLYRAKELGHLQLLLNFPKIKFALQHCELKCCNFNCNFRCAGEDLLNTFVQHIKECKYRHVDCSFCGQHIQRKNVQKHEERTCRSKPVKCPNEGCGRKIPAKLLKGHSVTCQYREEGCPNSRHGCAYVFAIKDKAKHLEICDYEQEKCTKCNNPYFRVDIETHHCGPQPQSDGLQNTSYVELAPAVFQCQNAHCGFMDTKQDIKIHSHTCVYRMEQCPHCGIRCSVNDLVWHKKQCDEMDKCSLCQQIVPSSSKMTHDRWLCRGRNIQSLCECCGMVFTLGTYQTHKQECTEPLIRVETGHSKSSCSPSSDVETHSSKYYSAGAIDIPTAGQDRNISKKSPECKVLYARPELDSNSIEISLHPSPQSLNRMWNVNKRKMWRDLMGQIERSGHHDRRDDLSRKSAYSSMSFSRACPVNSGVSGRFY